MSLNSYTGLKSALEAWLDNDSLTDQLDDFIDLAEQRHKDGYEYADRPIEGVRIRELLTTASFTLLEDTSTVALEDDFLDFKHLRVQIPTVTSGPKYYDDILEVTVQQITGLRTETARRPLRFTIVDSIQFDAPADQDYSGEIVYYKTVEALSDTNASNEILARSPGLYLFGALAESAPFIHDDERVQLWESKYLGLLKAANRSAQEGRRGGPLIPRIAGVRVV